MSRDDLKLALVDAHRHLSKWINYSTYTYHMSMIISLTDVLENKIVKEKELLYYKEQLEEIQRKIVFLETDLNITKQIISLIEQEKIIEIDTTVPILSFDHPEDE